MMRFVQMVLWMLLFLAPTASDASSFRTTLVIDEVMADQEFIGTLEREFSYTEIEEVFVLGKSKRSRKTKVLAKLTPVEELGSRTLRMKLTKKSKRYRPMSAGTLYRVVVRTFSSRKLSSMGLSRVSRDTYRVDLGFGVAYIPGTRMSGPSTSIEAMFNLFDRLSIGGRMESSVMLSNDAWGSLLPGNSPTFGNSLNVNSSLEFKVNYYLFHSAIRPFLGLGIGINSFADVNSSATTNQKIQGGKIFGLTPQLGLELGPFQLTASYKMPLGGGQVLTVDGNGTTIDSGERVSLSFYTILITFRVGGDRSDRT